MANAQFTQQWTAIYPPNAGGVNEAIAVARDARGNTYVTGMSTSATTGPDYVTIKYSPAGAQLWESRYDGLGGESGATFERSGVIFEPSGAIPAKSLVSPRTVDASPEG
jgi:hypothetical protein